MRKTILSLAAAALSMVPGVASAQSTCNVLNLSYTFNATIVGANQCTTVPGGSGGNVSATDVNNWLTGLGITWYLADADDSSSGSDNLISVSDFAESGTISFTGAAPSEFVVALKGGSNGAALYYFTGVPTTVGALTYSNADIPPNGGGNSPALSNARLFLPEGEVSVPEPATFGLVAVGMMGLAGVARRRRNQG